MKPHFSRRPLRSGFTLIEAFVSVAILGTLVALLLPAIQSVREATCSTQCRSRLHQVQLAFESFEGSHGYFPGKVMGPSFTRQIARYLEMADDQESSEVLACPSDPWSDGSVRYGRTSYVINDGFNEPRRGNGFLGVFTRYTTKRDLTDGLSNTAALSERTVLDSGRLNSVNRNHPTGPEVFWFRYTLSSSQPTVEHFIDECEWRHDSYADTPLRSRDYNHVLPPNRPSCYNGSSYNRERLTHADTAVSYHPGGVNLVLADGAIRFVSDSVSREVWWAIGTRASGETYTLR